MTRAAYRPVRWLGRWIAAAGLAFGSAAQSEPMRRFVPLSARVAACLAVVASLAAPVRAQTAEAQTAERVNAPFRVEAVLAPADLVEALAGVCGAACVEILEVPRGWDGARQLAAAVATPPDGPPVTARAWRPGTLDADDRPGADVPQRAVPTAWRGGQRHDWEVFGRHSAFVDLAPGRTLEAGPAASRAALDAALDEVRTDLLTQPARSAFVVPGAVDLWWTAEQAAEAARRARPRVLARVPLDALQAALPVLDTLNARAYVTAGPFGDALAHVANLAVYPDGYVERTMENGPPPLAQLLLVSTDAEPDTLAAPGWVRGYPAREYAAERPRWAYYGPRVYSSSDPAPTEQPLVRAVDVRVAPGRIARVIGPDTLVADRLLATVDLAALAGPATARAVESPELAYARAATPYRGVYADDREPGTVVAVEDGAAPVRFTLPADRYAVGVTSYCPAAGVGELLAAVASQPLAPCAGFSAQAYPESEAADLARSGGLVVVREHGPSAAVRLAWAVSWPAYRRSLLPAWAIPLAPDGEPERRRVGEWDALAVSALSDGTRVPGAPFAAYALFIDLDGRLVSVVGADASPGAARALAESLAATLAPATP